MTSRCAALLVAAGVATGILSGLFGVGGGVVKKEVTERSEASVMPRRARWIRDGVAEFHPDQNCVVTHSGQKISYDWLVVAAGIQINWNAIPGLQESVGKNGVCSNYSYDTVDSTWENVRNFRGGNAVFTQPGGAVKCGGPSLFLTTCCT